MNENAFLKEIVEYISGKYDSYCEYQKIIVQIFNEFHRVCSKNNFCYYLGFGSLLGAIRDDGLIPWDGDIDTLIDYKDREKLISILKVSLGNDYYIVGDGITPNYPHYMLRICKKGYDESHIHVDVFYMFSMTKEELKQQKIAKKIRRLIKQREYKYEKVGQNGFIDKLRRIRRALYCFVPEKYLNFKFNKIVNSYKNSENDYMVWEHGTHIFDKNIFGMPITINNIYFEALIPCNSVEFLRVTYGNFKEYLPIEKRFLEFFTIHNMILNSVEKTNE